MSASTSTTSGDRSASADQAASLFERFGDGDVADLITEFPLAWLLGPGGDARLASLLPLLPMVSEEGRLTGLIGHMARHNPLVEALSNYPRGLILFNGPQGYVSPHDASNRSWAPTWNYAQLRIEADIRFRPDLLDHALERLVTAMEKDRPDPWQIPELGARYAPMARAIIAFEVDVVHVEGRFKLGQDEATETLQDILNNRPEDDLARWMRRMNRHRL